LEKLPSFATQLRLTQPAVSFQIHSLEKEYKEVFFDRSGQSIQLTEAGKLFYEFALKIVELNEELLDRLSELRSLVRGKIEIAASNIPGEYILPIILGEFKKTYPDVEVKLLIHDTQEIISLLLSHEINLGFCGAAAKSVPLTFEEFAEDEIVIAMPPDHPLTQKSSIKAKDIKKFPIIMRERGSGTRKTFLEALSEAGIEEKDLNIVLELGSTQSVVSAVQSGLGIAPVSIYALKDHINSGSLTYRKVSDIRLRRPLYIAYNEKAAFSKAQEALLNLIRERKLEILRMFPA
jgi:DNA-binding transcriptional LysR family regulator